MNPWLSVTLLGVAIFGFAWLTPRRGPSGQEEGGSNPAYDRLLEDLEAENREWVDTMVTFKQEQDVTVNRLVKQIMELERQMKELAVAPAAAQAAPPAAAAVPEPPVPAAAPIAAAAEAALPEKTAPAAASIRVRFAELLTLHGKGRSVEQIAKSVGMNKGEVQLILQLARREEQQHG